MLPHQSWQPATFQLQLGFEFTPALPLPHPSTFYPTVKFTHSGWVEEYASAIARQYLAELLPNLASLQQSQPKIEALVKDAKTAGDRWNTDLTLTSRNFLQQNLQLDVLALRLLWCFSHSAYDVMQFMSGITVNLLQPGCTWQTGTLRLWIGLTVKTPDLDWHLDLMTGESPEVHSTAVELNSIVRSPQVAWLHQPMLLESLDARVRQHIAQATPELMLLIQGVEVDLLATDDQWQPGVMQLTISFEFIADITKWQGRDQREG
ncbi:MAG: hypothetical protein HC772_17225 [Leptolyngbyaceae cyanobacterium CRU_2_3]|nr:hypothetical protein [Leptolyngbyaceae cyanobacterium CRU_2_3]